MKRHLLVSAALALSLAACSGKAPDEASSTNSLNTAETVETTGSPASIGAYGAGEVSTPTFIEQAAMSDMYELEAAKIAVEKAKAPALKAFAQMMIKDHTASTAKLKQLVAAGGTGVTLPTALDAKHASMIEKLNGSTDKFDEEYTDQQSEAHRAALGLMDSYATHGDDAALKGFAAELKPKIQMHLAEISKLDHKGVDEPAK